MPLKLLTFSSFLPSTPRNWISPQDYVCYSVSFNTFPQMYSYNWREAPTVGGCTDRAISQAVSQQHSTRESQFQPQVRLCGICVGQSDNGPITVAARFQGMNYLLQLRHWNREFKSHLRHECLLVFILCLFCPVCAGSGLATGWSRNWKSGLVPTKGSRSIWK
jgi:hypothetical protein